MPFDRGQITKTLQDLAAQNIFIGTSSWKYRGWCGMLYEEDRYIYHGRFAESRFNDGCLAEYAGVFKTVCVDAAYYKFPDHGYLQKMVTAVSKDFQFALKVTDEITIKRFAKLPRFGARAGKPNKSYLNIDLFSRAFLEPCRDFKNNLGLLLFEFSRFYPNDYEYGRDFVADLDKFLSQLPRDWSYGVEVRNKHFLHRDYFAVLNQYGVAHVFNSWAEMPSVSEQMKMRGCRTNPSLCAARLLLKPGRSYEEAVKSFSPYDKIKEVYPEGRTAGAFLLKEAKQAVPQRRTFVYVNNRFEGNALETISAILDEAHEADLSSPGSRSA